MVAYALRNAYAKNPHRNNWPEIIRKAGLDFTPAPKPPGK